MQISKEMLIGELLQVDENMAQILMGAGMQTAIRGFLKVLFPTALLMKYFNIF